jgi:chemotaxis-related protein WspD
MADHRNTDAALVLLDQQLPEDYIAEWTRQVAQPTVVAERGSRSAVVVRLGTEWFALPTTVVQEVLEPRPVHSLPHRRGGGLLGVTTVRGELLPCVSLAGVLGLPAASAAPTSPALAAPRYLVLRGDGLRAVCPVDEVAGVVRFHEGQLKALPSTLSRAASRYSTALLTWRQGSAGVLDPDLVVRTLKRSLA